MPAHLQALLYRSREVFASALDEYDRACHQHDAEMDGIRAAFMAKWGRLPVLETYRQRPFASRRPGTSRRRCGGQNAASPSLTCGTCGREFQRTRLRGRTPLHCPECRDQTA
jgi:hypothetical protein